MDCAQELPDLLGFLGDPPQIARRQVSQRLGVCCSGSAFEYIDGAGSCPGVWARYPRLSEDFDAAAILKFFYSDKRFLAVHHSSLNAIIMDSHSFQVKDLKTRLDKAIAADLPEISRSQIQRDIEAGLVSVNGVEQNESKYVVRKDDVIQYRQPEIRNSKSEITATNTPLKVLYHDHGLLVIDKPAGLAVHPGAGFKGESLASALLYHFKDIQVVGEEGRPGIVHRLDKDTSGVMLVATTQDMYEYLKDAFGQRRIKKEYIALVAGRMEHPHGFFDQPIGRSKTDFRKYSTTNMVEAKPSLTEYRVLEYLTSGVIARPNASEGEAIYTAEDRHIGKIKPLPPRDDIKTSLDEYTLVLVKLHTGRTHQIRVHFSSAGFPLVGDPLYGTKKGQLPGLTRQFLHAKKIEVRLPDGTWIEAESDLAADLKEILNELGSKAVNQL